MATECFVFKTPDARNWSRQRADSLLSSSMLSLQTHSIVITVQCEMPNVQQEATCQLGSFTPIIKYDRFREYTHLNDPCNGDAEFLGVVMATV
jgi:hypothetical protein